MMNHFPMGPYPYYSVPMSSFNYNQTLTQATPPGPPMMMMMPTRGGRGGARGRGGMGSAFETVNHRNNEVGTPSPVLHLRNVTSEVMQLSIEDALKAFGEIRNVVMLRQKNQALVEMESTAAAESAVTFYQKHGHAEIDGRRVYVRFSQHQALNATQQVSKTLLVSMFGQAFQTPYARITPQIVCQIFSTYGKVEKVVVLQNKPNSSGQTQTDRIQALVQFDSEETSTNVKRILQGQPVAIGELFSFTLDIQYSRMSEIKANTSHGNALVISESGEAEQPEGAQSQSETDTNEA